MKSEDTEALEDTGTGTMFSSDAYVYVCAAEVKKFIVFVL